MFKLRGQAGAREQAEEEAHYLFVALDKDQDDRLSMLEFIMGAKNCTIIQSLLGTDAGVSKESRSSEKRSIKKKEGGEGEN